MSYPGRPQMVPGIPMPPAMGMSYMQLGGMSYELIHSTRNLLSKWCLSSVSG